MVLFFRNTYIKKTKRFSKSQYHIFSLIHTTAKFTGRKWLNLYLHDVILANKTEYIIKNISIANLAKIQILVNIFARFRKGKECFVNFSIL